MFVQGRRAGRPAVFSLTLIAIGASVLGGCQQPRVSPAERDMRTGRAYVYYLDGASGGGKLVNWSRGVREGLLDAGYDGWGEMFRWQTGLGLVADQTASVDYKRGKARELAAKIAAFQREHPNTPVTLIGLSAGTAIAVFALEELPPGVRVENVVLLSGSLSANYNLTNALAHVDGKLFVFTSQHDAILKLLLPLGGTADRANTVATIGVEGVQMPPGVTDATRALYAQKVVQVPWIDEFASYGNRGGHTDSVKREFVRYFVAPLVQTGTGATQVVAEQPPRGKVANPDYQRWAGFPAGAWTEIEGTQTVNGRTMPIKLRSRLVEKTPTWLLVERKYELAETDADVIPAHLFVTAWINPNRHPLTSPRCQREELEAANEHVAGHELQVNRFKVSVPGDFPDWGRNVRGQVETCRDVPGGLVRVNLQMDWAGKSIAFDGRLVDYNDGPTATGR